MTNIIDSYDSEYDSKSGFRKYRLGQLCIQLCILHFVPIFQA